MAMLSKEEKAQLLKMSKSKGLREGMRFISKNRYNPFGAGDAVDIDKFITFLTEFNAFINHPVRPFRKIIDKRMLL
jgi:hypothetical protein